MPSPEQPPPGVRVERFTPASVVSSYRGEAVTPGTLALDCHLPDLAGMTLAVVSLLVVACFGLWTLVLGTWLALSALAPIAAFLVYLAVRAQRMRARLQIGDDRLTSWSHDQIKLDVSIAEVLAIDAVEAPEKWDTTVYGVAVELPDGIPGRVMSRLDRRQARFIAELARAALGLDRPAAPRKDDGAAHEESAPVPREKAR